MPVDDMFDDRQPQPGAANLPGSCLVNAIETFGQAVNVFFGDWFAAVANSDTNMPVLNGADSYGDVRLRKAIFDRIVDEIVKHLVNLVRKALHHQPRATLRPPVIQNDFHVVPAGACLKAGNYRAQNLHHQDGFIGDVMFVDLDT